MTKTTNFVWDSVNDSVLSELDGTGTVQAVYTNEPTQYGSIVSQRRGTTTSTLLADGLGTTRLLTTSTQTSSDTYLYDAWGNLITSTGTTVNPYRWVGRYGYYQDSSTGLVYVRARMYQPTVARWCSTDPLLFIDGLNCFCLGQTTSVIDPTGMSQWVHSSPNSWPTSIPPTHSGCHCSMSAESMLPDSVLVAPTFPGRNTSCKVTFVVKQCEQGAHGKTPWPPKQIWINDPTPPWWPSEWPQIPPIPLPQAEFEITICDRGIQPCDEYTDTIEHELLHARDLCNPFVYPPLPKGYPGKDWNEYDKCMFREERAWRRQCERIHLSDKKAIKECIKNGAEGSCEKWKSY